MGFIGLIGLLGFRACGVLGYIGLLGLRAYRVLGLIGLIGLLGFRALNTPAPDGNPINSQSIFKSAECLRPGLHHGSGFRVSGL